MKGCLKNKLFFVVGVFMFSLSWAQVSYEKPYTEVVNFPECSGGRCGLESYDFLVQDYTLQFSPEKFSYGTRMFARYQTQKVEQLEDYAVVQLIRGCQFHSKLVNGDTEYVYNILREYFDERIPFSHKTWQIDSVDMDPMYNNTPTDFMPAWGTRHGLYRWNRTPGSFEQKSETLFYRERPQTPSLYVLDLPGTAFYESGVAKNISLQFKTCLFATKDIPLIGAPDDIDFASPLHCFEWGSSFVFDHYKKTFVKTAQIHPACL